MPRYIDADALRKKILNTRFAVCYDLPWNRWWIKKSIGVVNKILEIIKEFPSADVEEVKHSEWIEKEHWIPLAWDCSPLDYENYNEKTHSEKRTYWHCSECDFEKSRDMKPSAAYCERCGARMDG